MTLSEVLETMDLHARSSVVNVEPQTVAQWRECISSVLCAAAFDAGLAEARTIRPWAVVQCQGLGGALLDQFNIVRRHQDDSGWEHHGKGGFLLKDALTLCARLNGVRT
ncbi:MAG: hypothetical protein JNJ54_35135 [Myxococcaceae bacterium]|nr:hypothetical protein [Myxococcaceae bacterium]